MKFIWMRRIVLTITLLWAAYNFFQLYRPLNAYRENEETLEKQLTSIFAAGASAGGIGEQWLRERDTTAGLRSLTLAPSDRRFKQLIKGWRAHDPVIDNAQRVIAADDVLIPYYTNLFTSLALFAFALAFLWPPAMAGAGGKIVTLASLAFLIIAILALEYSDRAENRCLKALFEKTTPCSLAAIRFYAQAKFVLFWLVSLTTLLVFIAGFRRQVRFWRDPNLRSNPVLPHKQGGPYRELLTKEQKRLAEEQQSIDGTAAVTLSGGDFTVEASGELRVSRSRHDFVGLALSGGGIRSATFNLGILQGLHRFEILPHVDYLSTVSGGGYIGSFWSRWLKEHDSEWFPDRAKELRQNAGADSRVFEANEVRHIREFSNFLVPRIGIFDSETWGAAVAFLAAIGPAIINALCVLGLSLIAWLGLTFYLACPDAITVFGWRLPGKAVFLSGFTLLIFILMEIWWRAAPTGQTTGRAHWSVVIRSAAALVLVLLLSGEGLSRLGDELNFEPWQIWLFATPNSDLPGFWYSFRDIADYEHWWVLFGILNGAPISTDTWIFIPRLYEASLVWVLVAALFMILRFKGAFAQSSIQRRVMIPTNDRVAMRLLGLAASWSLVATFWHIGLNLARFEALPYILGSGAASGAGLFVLLRNWIGERLRQPHNKGLWERLKPYIPQILAYLIIGLAWAALASALININGDDWYRWYQATFIMSLPVALTFLVDPHEFGLHGTYRDRICRAYQGAALASDPNAADRRRTDFNANDDVPIAALLPRPLHLVCCAANNIGGDHLPTLSRGARSAVVSRDGVAMGCGWILQPGLQLGSAITASAAAANSNMGSVSMRVGPAVSFLMSALNLRLGVWVDNPEKTSGPRRDRLLPGLRYFKEMAALTDTTAAEIHLSDGGHFDNLGLYELIRRHCRYIIVSDATADPDVAFDDFGNTMRRIREDLGIEIIIDIEPLKPGPEKLARQHGVVGVIDYGIFDKGILIYIKPTLTGDEPPDIAQYKSRNAAFPHESTGDQFYDEAQWESYRRLGVHTANCIFGFVEHISTQEEHRTQKIFAEAQQTWYPTPSDLQNSSLQITGRFAQLEQQLKSSNAILLFSEVFPELNYTTIPTIGPAAPVSAEQELVNLSLILSAMTLMEDAITTCKLETHWCHPLNLGWVNLFARWATAPTFRRWWPLLKPMYGPYLRAFLEDRFEVLRDGRITATAYIAEVSVDHSNLGFAHTWWKTRHERPAFSHQQRLFEYRVLLPESLGAPAVPLQLAMVAVTIKNGQCFWTSEDLFVPFSLWGSPLAIDFLHRLLDKLEQSNCTECVVRVKGPRELEKNLAKWNERQNFVEYYRQAGFRLSCTEPDDEFREENGSRQVAVLTRQLG